MFAWTGDSGTTRGLSAIDIRLGIFLGGLRGGVVGLNLSCAFLSNCSASSWRPIEELAPRSVPCGETDGVGEGEETGSREIEEDSELSTFSVKAARISIFDCGSLTLLLVSFLCLMTDAKHSFNFLQISLTSSRSPLYKLHKALNNCVLLSRLFF